jgi:hypothetical protein
VLGDTLHDAGEVRRRRPGTTWLVGSADVPVTNRASIDDVASSVRKYQEPGITHVVLSDTPSLPEVRPRGALTRQKSTPQSADPADVDGVLLPGERRTASTSAGSASYGVDKCRVSVVRRQQVPGQAERVATMSAKLSSAVRTEPSGTALRRALASWARATT